MSPSSAIEISSLTALRGLAAFVVVLFHVNLLLDPNMRPLAGAVCAASATGIECRFVAVDYFFVLSGIVMMHVYRLRFFGHW